MKKALDTLWRIAVVAMFLYGLHVAAALRDSKANRVAVQSLMPPQHRTRLDSIESKIDEIIGHGEMSDAPLTRAEVLTIIRLGADKYEAANGVGSSEKRGEAVRIVLVATLFLARMDGMSVER